MHLAGNLINASRVWTDPEHSEAMSLIPWIPLHSGSNQVSLNEKNVIGIKMMCKIGDWSDCQVESIRLEGGAFLSLFRNESYITELSRHHPRGDLPLVRMKMCRDIDVLVMSITAIT